MGPITTMTLQDQHRTITMNERRSYFRINETIAIEVKAVAASAFNNTAPAAHFSETQSLKRINELRRLDADNKLLLSEIRASQRTIADYLENLNRKIDLIGAAILQENAATPPPSRNQLVNLSEGGIAFGSSQPFAAGDHLAIRLVFLEQFTSLTTYAVVVRSSPADKDTYQIAARFTGITEEEQQLIGQQIMRAQMAERRQQKPTL